MTEVAIHNTGALDVPAAPTALNPTVGSLVAWAESARAAHGIAQSLVETSFVPAQFRGKPAEATAAILAGAEVGLSPMAALRSFDIIQGTAAARANTLRAVVQGAGHDLWLVESTATRAIVDGKRRNSDKVQRSTWTIARAKDLGLIGKDNWKKQPQAMLVARATAECARLVASDAILGMPYSIEELEDADFSTPGPGDAAESAPTATRRARRAPLAPVPDAPAFPEDAAPDASADPASDFTPATDAQVTALNIALQEMGYGDDRAEKLAYLSALVGRDLASSKELSKDEASRFLDARERGVELVSGDLAR